MERNERKSWLDQLVEVDGKIASVPERTGENEKGAD